MLLKKNSLKFYWVPEMRFLKLALAVFSIKCYFYLLIGSSAKQCTDTSTALDPGQFLDPVIRSRPGVLLLLKRLDAQGGCHAKTGIRAGGDFQNPTRELQSASNTG